MNLGTILPLVLFILVLFVVAMFARRAAKALAITRGARAFQHEVTALVGRLTPVVDDLVRRVDAVRRHQLPANEVRDSLGDAMSAFERERATVDGWQAPSGMSGLVFDLADDIERLSRAVETIDHGTQLVTTGSSRQRELEAQTAIKRGYLNLLHARQSFQDHAALIASRAEAATKARGTSRA